MRHQLIALGILVATAAIVSPAHAQDYPWCAYYGGSFGDTKNCGFVTYQQCLATLSGMGGFCGLNNQYRPPAAQSSVRKRW